LKKSILYLDDEVACLNLFRSLFDTEYDVRTAATPEVARGMLLERPSDIIISDQNMPEISGTEFLAEIAEKYPSSYRAMVTGAMTLGDVFPEVCSGALHLFVAKPWDTQHLRTALERATLREATAFVEGPTRSPAPHNL